MYIVIPAFDEFWTDLNLFDRDLFLGVLRLICKENIMNTEVKYEDVKNLLKKDFTYYRFISSINTLRRKGYIKVTRREAGHKIQILWKNCSFIIDMPQPYIMEMPPSIPVEHIEPEPVPEKPKKAAKKIEPKPEKKVKLLITYKITPENKHEYTWDERITVWFHREILKMYPDNLTVKAATIEWIEEMRRMREIDKRNDKEIFELLKYVLDDSFWKLNIHSIGTFRKKYDKIKPRWIFEKNQKSGDMPALKAIKAAKPKID